MNNHDFITQVRDMCNAQLGAGPTPVPTPSPTPQPIPVGVVMMTMPNPGTSTFLDFEAGKIYVFPIPTPTGKGSVEIGEGRGTPALQCRTALSRVIGDFGYCTTSAASTKTGRGAIMYPCGTRGAPPDKIYWSLDPDATFDHCRVTPEQWYLMVQFDASGNQVFGYRTD